jgi:DNA-binding response OmpR family regulator
MTVHQKVLVIEHDRTMQRILFQCLNSRFSVKVLDNGLDALASLQDGSIPGIIIADYNSPVVNGIQLLEQLRARDRFRSIPIIILSDEKNPDARLKCLEAGADDYLVKPFAASDLLGSVRNRLSAISIQPSA